MSASSPAENLPLISEASRHRPKQPLSDSSGFDDLPQDSKFPMSPRDYLDSFGRRIAGISRPARPRWRPRGQTKGLGTIAGVFIPTVISIIGLVIFLRLGWAIGEAGLLVVLGMFFAGGVMAVLTDLSLSASATNGKMGGGGVYYLISRAVGPEFGGAVGLMFWIANTISITFYLQGFIEQMSAIEGIAPLPSPTMGYRLLIGYSALIVCILVCLAGSSLYAKSTIVIFVLQMTSIYIGNLAVLFRGELWYPKELGNSSAWADCNEFQDETTCYYFSGPMWDTFKDNLLPSFSAHTTWQDVYGVIFPALTGIVAGVNMSGVLRRPELSIPRGSLSSLGFCLVTYIFLAFSLAAAVPRDVLKGDKLILVHVTWGQGWPVIVGILISTSSSALAGLQGAARLLQAIALDRLLPYMDYFKKMVWDEPVGGIFLSAFLAALLLLVPSLDTIGPILSIFFLITYITMNAATFLHAVAGHPNFRPRFRFFHWSVSAFGATSCFTLMMLLNPLFGVIAFAIMIAAILLIAHRVKTTNVGAGWGAVTQALIFHQIRKYLLKLRDFDHVKFWRLSMLYCIHSPVGHVNCLQFLNHLKKGGLLIVGDAAVGVKSDAVGLSLCDRRRTGWLALCQEASLKAFVQVIPASTLLDGIGNLLVTSGLGGMRPNTLVLGWPHFGTEVSSESVARYHLDCVFTGKHGMRECHTKMEDDTSRANTSELSQVIPVEPNFARPGNVYRHLPRVAAEGARDLSNTSDGSAFTMHSFVNVLYGALSLQKNILLLRNFDKLDMSTFLRTRRTRGHTADPFDPRADDSGKTIDVWHLPGCAPRSMPFSLQLAAMLHEHPEWAAATTIRLCTILLDDTADLAATHLAFEELYTFARREFRVNCAIRVFLLRQDAPEIYEAAIAAIGVSGRPASGGPLSTVSGFVAESPVRSVDSWTGNELDALREPIMALEDVPERELFGIMMRAVRALSGNSQISFIPLPLLPKAEALSVSEELATEWTSRIANATESHGPIVFTVGIDLVVSADQ